MVYTRVIIVREYSWTIRNNSWISIARKEPVYDGALVKTFEKN